MSTLTSLHAPPAPAASSAKLSAKGLVTLGLALVMFAYAAILVAGWGKPGSWIIDDKGTITFTDFTALYGAGRLALEGKAALAYDWAAHAEAMSAAIGRAAQHFPYPYPPTFFAIVAPLSALPYLPALLVWMGLTLALHLYTCARIVGSWQGAIWLGAMIVTLANIIAGQNGFLTAALMGAGLLLVPARPMLAGVLLGLLAYKPHLGLLLPIALAAAGQWRVFGTATATVIAAALVTLGVFGLEPWWAFLDNLGRFGSEIATERFSVTNKLQSAYGFLSSLGVPKPVSMAIQLALAAFLVAATALIWRSTAPTSLKAAWLSTASVLMSPYVYIYDLTLLAVAQAFLLRHWLRPPGPDPLIGESHISPEVAVSPGFTGREAILLLAANALIVLMMSIKLPMGFTGSLFLLGAIAYEARSSIAASWPRWRRGRAEPRAP
jgi:hypothetical protein